ncbi:MAG: undecaprenyl-diphosphate phosphatase [Bifidobacteriaceae bacterium]|nr:undecaprenyl-diphosphate phosphatase [Bifidobacteriaceae bacterium]
MSLWEALILGIVQGLTEFLPISSSAHVRLVGEFLPTGADPGAAFTAIIQIGTELAVVLYFRREVVAIARGWWRNVWRAERSPEGRMGWLIIAGSVPIVVLGLIFTDAIETHLRNLYITAAMLIGFGLILGWADARASQRLALRDLTVRDGVLFGFAQALALVPGVSRSGGTITAGLLMGYTREAAARYSFLLAMPAVFGSGLFELATSIGEPGAVPGWIPTMTAGVTAFVIGYVVIIAFLKIVSTYSYRPFVLYRLGLGALVLVLLASGAISPL